MEGDRGDGRPGEKGPRGLREVEVVRTGGGGSRIHKVVGSGRKKGKITHHCAIFCNQKNAKRPELTNTGREPGLKGTGSGGFKPPFPPVLAG